MKKMLAMLLVLFMAAAVLAGCGAKTDGTGETAASSENKEGTKEDKPSKPDYGDWNGDWGGDGDWGIDMGTGGVTIGDVMASQNSGKEYDDGIVRSSSNDISEVSLGFNPDGTYVFGENSTYYSNDLTLTIKAPEGAKVYYTLDGRMPNSDSLVYTEPLMFAARGGSFPVAYTLRAVACLADGTYTKTAVRTYIVAKKLEGRFSTVVFSITGDPDQLTNAPDGILYGENWNERGRASERPVYVEAWRADGTQLLSQYAGVRVYGGYSRRTTIKSMKLYSRASYDPDNKNFKFAEFGTPKLDGSDKIIKKYDKLVLRNYGNDMQFAFVRDELSQTLCKLAGFECYEAVIPAVAYLNGEYYGFYWLHENYCDKFFKEKFGDAEGEFVLLEGKDDVKDDDEDPSVQKYVDEFNRNYKRFSQLDLTNDSNYRQLCDFMDVESYLDFFAWNVMINNWDWPNNNNKCFRYVEAPASKLGEEGAKETPDTEYFDGRWRYVMHDMDFTYGLYGNTTTQASFDTLKIVLNENDERYAPLFAALMQRKDCRSYFRNKTMEFLDGAFSEDSIVKAYKELHATRKPELAYFYKYIEQRGRKGDSTMWTNPGNYAGNEEQILTFARERRTYCIKYMDKLLPELE